MAPSPSVEGACMPPCAFASLLGAIGGTLERSAAWTVGRRLTGGRQVDRERADSYRVPTARETSGVTVQLALGHVRDRAGDAAVEAVLRRAELPYAREALESATTWISYDERLRLFE